MSTQNNTESAGHMPSYLDPKCIETEFTAGQTVGSGNDGVVVRYIHRLVQGKSIVVKYPRNGTDQQTKNLIQELKAMKVLHQKPHANVVELLGWDEHWAPHALALFFEDCSLGDARAYRGKLISAVGHVPEETLWKFIADISQGLRHLTHAFKHAFINGDVKPANILVAYPPGGSDNKPLPTVPVFKLADFSHVRVYTPNKIYQYTGTRTYAPPLEERKTLTPAADIWGMGASLQYLAYGTDPTQNWFHYLQDLKDRVKIDFETYFNAFHDRLTEAKMAELRHGIPVVYRPLDASPEDQINKWGVKRPYVIEKPYSTLLNGWYMRCMQEDVEQRVKADELVRSCVPLAEHQIRVFLEERAK